MSRGVSSSGLAAIARSMASRSVIGVPSRGTFTDTGVANQNNNRPVTGPGLIYTAQLNGISLTDPNAQAWTLAELALRWCADAPGVCPDCGSELAVNPQDFDGRVTTPRSHLG